MKPIRRKARNKELMLRASVLAELANAQEDLAQHEQSRIYYLNCANLIGERINQIAKRIDDIKERIKRMEANHE